MKARTIALAGVCAAWGALLPLSAVAQNPPAAAAAPTNQPAPAPQPMQTFQLAFCNISAYSDVYVAITSRKDAQTWTVSGWYQIPDSGCTLVGSFPADTVYYYARGSNGAVWSAADDDQTGTGQCVDLQQWFTASAGVPTCPTGQQVGRFKMIKAQANQGRLTWTLTGGK